MLDENILLVYDDIDIKFYKIHYLETSFKMYEHIFKDWFHIYKLTARILLKYGS